MKLWVLTSYSLLEDSEFEELTLLASKEGASCRCCPVPTFDELLPDPDETLLRELDFALPGFLPDDFRRADVRGGGGGGGGAAAALRSRRNSRF